MYFGYITEEFRCYHTTPTYLCLPQQNHRLLEGRVSDFMLNPGGWRGTSQ